MILFPHWCTKFQKISRVSPWSAESKPASKDMGSTLQKPRSNKLMCHKTLGSFYFSWKQTNSLLVYFHQFPFSLLWDELNSHYPFCCIGPYINGGWGCQWLLHSEAVCKHQSLENTPGSVLFPVCCRWASNGNSLAPVRKWT